MLYGYSDEAKAELLKTLNLNEAVNETTAPAFIWATAEDTVVPADNALRFALALDKCGVKYELHIYPNCDHGTSTGKVEINYVWEKATASDYKRISKWLDDCVAFFGTYCVEQF